MLYRVYEWKNDCIKVYDVGVNLSEEDARKLCHSAKKGFSRDMELMNMYDDE